MKPPAARRGARGPGCARRRARARASGVDRRPGADDGVGDAGADPLVDQRGAERGGLHGPPVDHRGSVVHARQRRDTVRRMTRPRVVLVHGFTQTGGRWGPVAERLGAEVTRSSRVDCPGHGRPAHVRLDLAGTAAARRPRPAGGRPTSATRWAGASPSTSRSTGPSWSSGSCSSAPPPASTTPTSGPPAATPTRPGPADRARRRRRRSSTAGWPSRSSPALPPERPRSRRAPGQHRRRAGRVAAPAGTGTMDPPCGTELPALTVPSARRRRARRQVPRPWPTAWPPSIGGDATVAHRRGRRPRRPPRGPRRHGPHHPQPVSGSGGTPPDPITGSGADRGSDPGRRTGRSRAAARGHQTEGSTLRSLVGVSLCSTTFPSPVGAGALAGDVLFDRRGRRSALSTGRLDTSSTTVGALLGRRTRLPGRTPGRSPSPSGVRAVR